MATAIEQGHLDASERGEILLKIVSRKAALRHFYRGVYELYGRSLDASPKGGLLLELGSGASFAKDTFPDLITSDVIPYSHVDRVVDAQSMDLPDQSLSCLVMMNVLHHIPDSERFFHEASRTLVPGGEILIFDQNLNFLSKFVFKHLHHEGFEDDGAPGDWKFRSSGPLSGANGALAHNIFRRDLAHFQKRYPALEVVSIETHFPLLYWLCGGLKSWSLVPAWLLGAINSIDRRILKVFPNSGSFLSVRIKKR